MSTLSTRAQESPRPYLEDITHNNIMIISVIPHVAVLTSKGVTRDGSLFVGLGSPSEHVYCATPPRQAEWEAEMAAMR